MILATSRVRHRLLERINEPCLAPITLVAAPAGYGKSTLVEQWAQCSGHPVAWVSLGPESNTPSRFQAQLAAAIELAAPDRDTPLDDDGSLDAIVHALDRLAQSGQRPVLVFDDYHQIASQDIHEAMDGLISRFPDRAHVILISRTIPPLSLGRLHVEGIVRHLTEEDLQFTREETWAIIGQHAPGRLTELQIATLGERTDGWIAGIRLALASLDRVDPAAVPSLVDAWPVHRWLDDYIVEEVLAALPEDVGAFVLRTVILPELTPALCDAVLGIETSAGLMEEVSARLVFVRPDPIGGTLTYHPLFAESVGRIADRQWPASDRRERHRRAALWYEGQGQLESAVEQAVAAEEWEIAERCLRPLCKALMDSSAHQSRLYWLRKLPEDRVLADPDLARWYITALQYTGQLREAHRLFAVAGPMWETSGDPAHLGYATSARTLVATMNGETDRALELAYESLRHFPPDRAIDRMQAWTAVIQFEFHRGNDDAKEHAYRQAALCREHLPVEQWWWTFQIELERANQQALRGNLRAARDMFQETLDRLQTIYSTYEPRIRFLLAAIALEWNELDAAARQAEIVARGLESAPLQLWHTDALLMVARVHEALGDAEQATSTLRRLREMHDQYGGDRLLYRLEALEVLTWLRSGKVDLAEAWVAHAHVVDQPWVRVFGDVDPRLSAAQVEIADGQYACAAARLRLLIDQARAGKRWAEIVPLGVWHAVTCVELGDDEAALASLRLSLHHGMPGGFVRSFITPGHDLTPFLRRVAEQLTAEEAVYAHRVIGGDGDVASAPVLPVGVVAAPASPPMFQALGSLLSGRQLEVLELLHAGYSNREIADRLFITEHTAKKHVASILQKLGVSNRTAAVTRALELGVL